MTNSYVLALQLDVHSANDFMKKMILKPSNVPKVCVLLAAQQTTTQPTPEMSDIPNVVIRNVTRKGAFGREKTEDITLPGANFAVLPENYHQLVSSKLKLEQKFYKSDQEIHDGLYDVFKGNYASAEQYAASRMADLIDKYSDEKRKPLNQKPNKDTAGFLKENCDLYKDYKALNKEKTKSNKDLEDRTNSIVRCIQLTP